MRTLHPNPAAVNAETSPREWTLLRALGRAITVLALPMLTAATIPLAAAAEPVQLQLVIPPARTHVIGDEIPLLFRFENQATNPLAFMWEGCCRFNGKLTVTRDGREVPPTPPGQALAHMFAKAERLDPGQPKDFDTRLGDWVTLADTGTYELRGRYQGVLPFQQPQVPRGLDLWRETADAPPIRVAVLSVPDYLSQRESRSSERGIHLTAKGATRIAPVDASEFVVRIENHNVAPAAVRWPFDFALWVVNRDHVRVPTLVRIEAPFEELTLAAGVTLERKFSLEARDFEGLPFGGYSLFVDLAATETSPRVPSVLQPVEWNLATEDVVALLNAAASGSSTGARNAPLKLLRVYLGELGAQIAAAVESVSPEAQPLARDLAFAAAVRPLRPTPGTAELKLRVTAGTASAQMQSSWEDAPLRSAMPKNAAPIDTLRLVEEVRRHLGWEVAVNLVPDDGATLGAIAAAAREVNTLRDGLARAPRVNLSADTNRVCTAEFPVTPAPATLLLRLAADHSNGILQWGVHRVDGAPTRPVTPDGVPAEDFTAVESLEALLAELRDVRPAVFVRAPASLAWEDFRGAVQPMVARGISFEVGVRAMAAPQPE